MQETLTLRRFKLTDLERVTHINRVCLPENYTTFFFMDLYERFPETFVVAEKKGEVLGYVMCRIETALPTLRTMRLMKRGHVISIAVLPGHQHQGIGYALMQEAMRAMLLYNAKECFLEVRTSNTPAINLYKKMKFQITRTIHAYYADGEDAYVMSRKLPFDASFSKEAKIGKD